MTSMMTEPGAINLLIDSASSSSAAARAPEPHPPPSAD